jgi:diketogulonate reductase-like aldo/keto reductase
MQRNVIALAKSTHIERMRENFEIFDFELSASEMKQIAELDTKTSQFFNHQTPEAVEMFLGFIEQRKGKR